MGLFDTSFICVCVYMSEGERMCHADIVIAYRLPSVTFYIYTCYTLYLLWLYEVFYRRNTEKHQYFKLK